LVWADNQTNQNSAIPGSDLHAPFQLSASGEAIGLFGPDGFTPQSTVIFGQQIQNVSQGFFPDGNTNTIYYMTNFTPRLANTLSAPLRLVNVLLEPGAVTVSWSAVAGHRYSFQYKDDLSDAAWTSGVEVKALGPTASASDNVVPGAHRFYRVVRID
ncbi:MAG TPA: hypothetical protein VMZ27_12735, partial [Candidatus Saccharimonadales bacterium]|nr:hypothetical protein [Candidatus Saccharimonadales bacterium]